MRLVRTEGRGGKETRQMLRELELRGARNTARAMTVVQRIVTDVRKGGDKALRRYAAKLDGLAKQQPLAISRAEMEQAWDATPKALQAAMETAAGEYPGICCAANAERMERDQRRAYYRTAGAGAGRCGMLCAQRTLSVALHFADDGDSGTGSRGGTDRGGVAEAGQGDTCSRGVAGG